jgi:spermidine synthase/MFS family permease
MLALLFFLSGVAALVYQVVWLRQLVLVVGSTASAVSTVVAVFLAGLGIGAWAFGRLADRSRSPLRLYAYLELGVAVYALLLPGLILATTPTYVALARELAGHPALLTLLRVSLGLVLLPPTVLMGGSLPALVRAVGTDLERLGGRLGALYAANLAGGVIGSLASGFVLIRELGVEGTTRSAVLLNLVVAALALRLAIDAPAAVPSAPPGAPTGAWRLTDSQRPIAWVAVFLSGFLSLSYEMLWTRALVFSFSSTVYAFALILATFLTGLALGSELFVVLERRRAPPLAALGATQALAGICALCLTPLAARSDQLIALATDRLGMSGWAFLAGSGFAAGAIILLPATLMGVALPLGMRLLVDDVLRSGRRVGLAYLVNTVGSVLGSLLTGFVLIPVLSLKGALLATAAVQIALAAACLARGDLPAGWRQPVAASVALALLPSGALALWLLRGPNPFDSWLAPGSGPAPSIVAHQDGVGASVTVVDYPDGRRSLRIDGFEAAANSPGGETGYMPMMAHLPLLLHPDPRQVLVVCFGTGSTAGAVLAHDQARVDVVDINPGVFAYAELFAAANFGVARSPRARLLLDDGRNYLLTGQQRYDVITSEPMPPEFAGVVNLYAREYYELARAHLRPGGLLVQWLPFHLVTLQETVDILKTVQSVFPQTTLWLHSSTGIIVAGLDPIEIDGAGVEQALSREPLRSRLERLGVRDLLDLADLHALGPASIRAATRNAGIITDDRPSLEFHEPRHRVLFFQGPFTRDQARAMEVVLRLRAGEPAPVSNARPEQAASIAERRLVGSHRMLGDTYYFWGHPHEARTAYENAARAASQSGAKVDLLLLAAESARLAAETPAAEALVREVLTLRPDDPRARLVLQQPVPSPQP